MGTDLFRRGWPWREVVPSCASKQDRSVGHPWDRDGKHGQRREIQMWRKESAKEAEIRRGVHISEQSQKMEPSVSLNSVAMGVTNPTS